LVRRNESWVSEELERALGGLSAQQAAGVLRIVQAEIEGRSLASLMDCQGQMCTSTTFYGSGKRKGWRHKPAFNQALEVARRDYRRFMLDNGVNEALAILATTAPQAAQALRQGLVGEGGATSALVELLGSRDAALRTSAARELAGTGRADVVPALVKALKRERDPEARGEMMGALGRLAGWRDSEQRAAALAILDRADVKTAAKAMQAHGGSIEYVDVTEDELAELERALRGEAEGSGQAK